jgi:hypothetical protein
MLAIGTLADFRAKLLNPTVDRCSINNDAPFGQKIADISVRKRISAIPPHSRQYHILRKAVMLERITSWHLQFLTAESRASNKNQFNATEP